MGTQAVSFASYDAELVLAPGARVVVRDEEWLVRHCRRTSLGGLAVHVTGLSELVRNKTAIFLSKLDQIEELLPENTQLVADPSPRFRRSKLYLESLLRRTPPTDERLYVGHRAAMDSAPYQLLPAAQALAQPRPRILIADGVGLGKTLEVGILLAELIRRGRGERILVVALKSILAQFQEEMWARFTIPLVRLDSLGLQRVQAKIPSNMNPFYYFNRCIISIDTLKKNAMYARHLEACHWDAIVIDECQNVAVRSRGGGRRRSQRARLASLLANTCDALIMTSATPHDGSPESFASLMHLLDPTAIVNPSAYTKEDIRGLYLRRFKKDVAHQLQTPFHERALHPHTLPASPAEEQVFTCLSGLELRTVDRKRNSRGLLFRTLLLKSFLSSPQALCATIDARLRHKLFAAPVSDAGAAHDLQALRALRACAATVTGAHISKLAALRSRLEQIGVARPRKPRRAVVFSERLATLAMLQSALCDSFGFSAEQVPIFHGTLDDVSQQQLVRDFGTENSKVRVLLASDAAAEGINLHFFCNHLLHFDLPWSLITLEQRNGRIDRFGQEQTPHIDYFLTQPRDPQLKGDLRVLERLMEKEQAAHENLGDVAWLLNLHDPAAEELRIGRGIENREPAEQIVPDLPEPFDFMQLLLADEQQGPQAETVSSQSLYPDDLEFAREAFDELSAHDARIERPEWLPHADGFSLHASEDLKRRFDHLPRELRDKSWKFRLTIDRPRVQRALAEARQDEGRWPAWQLWWNLHPIAGWLQDRVLACFTRHEAPLVQVPRGLAAGDACYLFQGIVSNQRSQPVLVRWFGVLQQRGEVVGLEALIGRTGLAETLSNPGREPASAAQQAGIAAALEHARAYMSAQRRARRSELMPRLQDEERRVQRWAARARQAIAERRQRLEQAGRGLRSDQRKRLERAAKDIEQRLQARARWLREGLQTVDRPYLRLVAVLLPAAS